MKRHYVKVKVKRDKYYVVLDMERGVVESITVFDDKESAYNWIRNFCL